MAIDPSLLQQFQTTNPRFTEQYRQNQEEQNAEQPGQVVAKTPEPPSPPQLPRRPYRPPISGGRFHSQHFVRIGSKRKK